MQRKDADSPHSGKPLRQISLVGEHRLVRMLQSAPETDRKRGDPRLPITALVAVDRGLLGIDEIAKVHVLATPDSTIADRLNIRIQDVRGEESRDHPAAYHELSRPRSGVVGLRDKLLGQEVREATATVTQDGVSVERRITVVQYRRLRRELWNEYGYPYTMKVE